MRYRPSIEERRSRAFHPQRNTACPLCQCQCQCQSIRNSVLITTCERNTLATAVAYPPVPRRKLKSVLCYVPLLFSCSSESSTLEARRVRSRLGKSLIWRSKCRLIYCSITVTVIEKRKSVGIDLTLRIVSLEEVVCRRAGRLLWMWIPK